MLALLVRARYENGEPITDQHIADEMLTLLVSGHETTAGSLAWTVERLVRHPELLSRLTEEVDAGGSELRQATIAEVQRTRTVLDSTVRCTKARIRLGEWVIPENSRISWPSRWSMIQMPASQMRCRSTRTDSSAVPRSRRPGFRSAAASTVASARRSPPWRWTSPCAYCCANSVSRQPMRRTNDDTVMPTGRRAAREQWFTDEPRRRRTTPTLRWWPITAPGDKATGILAAVTSTLQAVPQADRPVTRG